MNTLHKLQSDFSAAIVDKDNIGTKTSVHQSILSKGISGERRLQIYHNNVYISLQDALRAVYPVVCRLVGEEFFRAMANEYIDRHPSHSGNLHDFGSYLASFIEEFEPVSNLVYLSDVARLEWAYHQVFHSADCNTFDIEALEKLKPHLYCHLIFELNPASRLITSPYPILRIWQFNRSTIEGNDTAAEENENISLDEGRDNLLVIRRNLEIAFQRMSPAEFAFLKATEQKSTFQEACDAAVKHDPRCDISQLLLALISSQTIVDFEIAG